MYICPPFGPAEGPARASQIGLQFVGIVGQSFEFLAGDDDGAGVALGIDVDRGRGVGNLYFLRLHFDGQRNVQAQGLIRDLDIVVFVQGESLEPRQSSVYLPGAQSLEFIHALSVGLDRDGRASRRRHDDGGAGDSGAGLIGDLSAQRLPRASAPNTELATTGHETNKHDCDRYEYC